jgi:hypothetical protein
MGIGTYAPQSTAVRYNTVVGGSRYFYSVSTNPLTPGNPYFYNVSINASTNAVLRDGADKPSIPQEISVVIADLNNTLKELQSSAATQQNTLARLERDLQNPNLTPTERTALQARIDRFKATTIAETQLEIRECQAAITEVQSNSTGIFQSMQSTLAENIVPPNPTPTIDNTTTNTGTPTTNSTNTLDGAASDESGTEQTTTSTTTATATGTGATTEDESVNTNAPTEPGTEREDEEVDSTTQGSPPYDNEKFLRVSIPPNSRPGRRIKNPLGYLASYTYQLSLYMISPGAYEAFVAGGRKNINLYNEQLGSAKQEGTFLVAQGGGVGSEDKRAPGFEYDYYIDNVSFIHHTSAKETGAALMNTEFKFQIVEPYGFSFISNLRRARNLMPASTGTGRSNDTTSDPIRQFYILGVRFFGWDQSGRQVTGNEIFNGDPIDPNASGDGSLFETFYEILITDIKFKIDGKATTYNVSASAVGPNAAINVRKGMINSTIESYGSTVRDYLSGPKGLITQLNQEQQDLVKNKTVAYPITYKILWLGDAEQIAISSVVSENRTDKATQPASTATDVTQVNDGTSTKAAPNKTQEKMSFSSKPIIQAIDQIIARSKYLEDAVAFNYTDNKEYNAKTSAPNIGKTPNRKLTWFNITPEITGIEWDNIINDWSYNITYIIQTYLIPHIDNPFAGNEALEKKYYGAHKKYEYWYTGQNTEIIGFEQNLNTAYYNNVVAGNPKNSGDSATPATNETTPANSGASTAPNTTSTADKDGSGGTLSMEAVNSVRTTLYDPNSYATAKVQILGDPDYLMQEVSSGSTGINQAYSRHYGDGFTINPSGGQVFFEIDFKEAVDYSTSGIDIPLDGEKGVKGQGGTMSINDSILFWQYADEVKDKITGVAYMLTKVTSTFRNGSFTQSLEAVNPFPAGQLSKESQAEVDRLTTESSNGGVSQQTGEPSNTGMPADPPVDTTGASTTPAVPPVDTPDAPN